MEVERNVPLNMAPLSAYLDSVAHLAELDQQIEVLRRAISEGLELKNKYETEVYSLNDGILPDQFVFAHKDGNYLINTTHKYLTTTRIQCFTTTAPDAGGQ